MNKAFFVFPFAILSLVTHFAFAADDAAEAAAKAKQARIFKAADLNGDGGVNRSELARATSAQFDIIKDNFDQMDTNKDGKVTPEERDAWVEAQRKALFDKMDTNHDGTVSPEERAAYIKAQEANRYKFGK